MNKLLKLVIVTALVFSAASISSASINQFVGEWNNVDPHPRGLTRMAITADGARMTVEAWGQCRPTDCYWGKVPGRLFGPTPSSEIISAASAVTAFMNIEGIRHMLVIHPSEQNQLEVEVFTDFSDGRTDYAVTYRLRRERRIEPVRPVEPVRPIGPESREDCLPMNPNALAVKNINGSWKIVSGSEWLFDFGNKQDEAAQSLKIIRRYDMNQVCYIGRPGPSFQYLLSNGRAPSGSFPGEDCISFNPGNLRVERIRGNWTITDGSHAVFAFGDKESEAQDALRIIRKYGFTQSCFVGRPDPSFTYLKR